MCLSQGRLASCGVEPGSSHTPGSAPEVRGLGIHQPEVTARGRDLTTAQESHMTTKDNTLVTPEGVVEQLRLIRQNIPEYSQRTAAASAPLRRVAITDFRFVDAC